MKNSSVKNLTLSAFFAALIFIITAYLHVPSVMGYTHVGDAFIYLASSLLPTQYAVAASAIGAALADGLSGYSMWIIPTLIIKSLTAVWFTNKAGKILCKRNFLALIPAFILCVGGYYFAAAVLTGSYLAATEQIPGFVIQVMLSSILYMALGMALDKANFKQRMRGGK